MAQTSVIYQPEHPFRRLICAGCGHEIVVPIYCGNRFCPICSLPRRLRVQARLDHIIKNLTLLPKHGLSHLTLTIPNSATVSEGCRKLVTAFRRLRSTRRWKHLCAGGAFVIEVTGLPGSWHVHLHVVLQNVYFPQAEISKSWLRYSGGSNVWIKRISRKTAVNYLTKYLAKSEVDESSLSEVSIGLRGFRLFQPFGCWLKILHSFVKRLFPCKKCGQISWIPEDLFHCWGRNIDYIPEIAIAESDRGEIEEEPHCHDPCQIECPF
jgi:hypothetical protein